VRISLIFILALAALGGGCGGKRSATTDPQAEAVNQKFSKQDKDKKMTAADKARLRYIEGRQICAQSNYAGAIPYFKEAVKIAEKAEYYLDLGRCYHLIGRYGDALRAYARAEELGGGDDDETRASLQANIGDVFQQREDAAEALRYYYAAISLMPDYARAHYEIGNLLLKEGKYAESVARLSRSLTIDPAMNKARLSRAIAYRMTKQYELAYRDLQDLDQRGFAVQPDLEREILAGISN
jgi:tetratricopeptide (TPR) repeat protein